jgi:hypothetical protein
MVKYDKSDLWILGDSFTESDSDGNYWTDILIKNFNGENRYLNAGPGRDIQTTMDLFYKNIHNISDTSLVLIFLPTVARLRYPKKKEYFNEFLEAGWHKELNDKTPHNFRELFLHWPYEDYPNGNTKSELDFPFDSIDLNQFDGTLITYDYQNEKEKLSEVDETISRMDFARLLNTNEATLQNWNDIFYSLKRAFTFKVMFFSWTDEYDMESVLTKKAITNLIGYWHTQDDEYKDSNGNSGIQSDEHFSLKMHKAFAELIMDMNKTYFK